jgi:hypothetical protein
MNAIGRRLQLSEIIFRVIVIAVGLAPDALIALLLFNQ